MAKWEYRIVTRAADEALTAEDFNKFGENAFELVTVFPVTLWEKILGKEIQKATLHYFFKRPKG